MALTPQQKAAARRFGPRVDKIAQRYLNPVTGKPLSGAALLAKLDQGEGVGTSSAGAKGETQFMPGTRDVVLKKTHGRVDPWRSPSQADEAAAMHLRGDLGNAKGLEGYNPGGGKAYVNYILGQKVGNLGAGRAAQVRPTSAKTTTTPGVDNSAARRAMMLNYLSSGQRHQPDGALQLAAGLATAPDTPAKTVTAKAASARSPTSANPVGRVVREANRIDQARVPYQWGGGHGARQPRGSAVTPVDCSGAVSRALGLDPRVSGDFAKWGRPGTGGRVTVYANAKHVLMEVDGHFWGTSASNPGGGPGWIPRSKISPAYLTGFTARHSDRLG